jgi:alpha-ketoglutarate-dependent 2,4-dichlorophenoxyacetate dioxygenase
MELALYPVTPGFAAEVGDVDVARADADTVAAIEQALWRYAVLIFPDQRLTAEQHLAFAAHFGPPDRGFVMEGKRDRVGHGLIDVSNLTREGEVWDRESRLRALREGDKHWHTDSAFAFVPAKISMLYARSIPPVGGFTEFADERMAYDALPDDLRRRIEGRAAWHDWFASRRRYGLTDFPEAMRALNPPAPQAIVRTLPETGRRTLYLASHMARIEGLDAAEAGPLIEALIAHATQPQFVYRHRWRAGDLVIWDDRCTMHRGTDYDDVRWRRDFQRATVGDVANSLEQEGLPVPVESA